LARFVERLKSRARSRAVKRDVAILDESGLFDRAWYLKRNPDVAEHHVDPVWHYLLCGAQEGRDPSGTFSTSGYLETYPDVLAKGANPLLHYLKFGRAEGRVVVRRDYAAWIEQYDQLTGEDRGIFHLAVERFAFKPLISILLPVYNTKAEHLERAIHSVIDQLYPHWELCISDDASTDPKVKTILEDAAARDSRIKLIYRDKNGHIAANSNSALKLATGDYVGVLDHDDELAAQALLWFVEEIQQHSDAEIIYCDEDKLDGEGVRTDPLFKPDWNPALILSQNYVSHFTLYRRALIEAAGGFRIGFEGSQDHDLLLRCAELVEASQIRHIPRILYHWRSHAGSTSSDIGLEAKPYAWEAGARAIQEHLDRTGVAASLRVTARQFYQVDYVPPSSAPEVTVIIPTALKIEIIEPCMTSILRDTTYPNVEFIVVANRSQVDGASKRKFLARLEKDPRVRLLMHDEHPFNYSRTNNLAVRQSDAPIICFLNDDVEVIGRDWLDKLVARVSLEGVGAVGAMLYYPGDTIQHAGVILGMGGVAGHAFLNLPRGSKGYHERAILEQDLSCVTAACMTVRREAFDAAGGFDEALAIAFNDVDLCIRVRQKGWRIIWTPAVEMYHHESASVGQHSAPHRHAQFEREVKLMRERWGEVLDSDPFFNPNLSLTSFQYKLAFPPRLPKLPHLESRPRGAELSSA
jgi:GT2 family glycosyltransferase